ncbi:AAA family ATPase [Mesorhizobium sp. L103C131B0]|uniref:AAA family ATPase n=1 Tax=Mesorhizobium sp. L103C131B0 TaxID=1287089 RepID=UPI00042579D9|nr:AAA family ATPase [Mesorhizobium sp. L103C131B0]
MFLETLRIQNIRSIADIAVDFADRSVSEPAVRKWSLLVGQNGTGKSTILKAAALLLAGSDALPDLVRDPKEWVRNGESAGRISGRLRTQDWEPRDISLDIVSADGRSDILKRNDAGLAALDQALSHASQNYFTAAYGPYRRVSDDSRALSTGQLPRANCLTTLFDKNAVVYPLATWAMSLDYQLGEDGLGIVRKALDDLLPGIQFSGIDKGQGRLLFQTDDGIVPLDQLSDGFQNVAAWIGDLLYRITEAFAHRRDPLKARGLLLIDEIDAHLHPAWQRRLREFLTTTLPNFQIVATTHSALTLQQAKQDETIILSRDANRRVLAAPFPGDPSKLRLHQLYDLAFRISSLDSWEIEQNKEIYRDLSAKPAAALTPEEVSALESARQTLELVPESKVDGLGNEALESYFTKLSSAVDALERSAPGQVRAVE